MKLATRRTTSARRACVGAIGLAVLLGACSGPAPRDPTRPDPAREQQTRQFAQRGYHAESRHAFDTSADRWSADGREIDVVLSVPHGDGPFPLVLYLPGLGESAAAGSFWREAWASAGYAVASVQSAASGPAIRGLPDARNGDMARIAREQFGSESLNARVSAIRFVHRELMRRASQGVPLYTRVASSRLVVTGYDLGAQTAYALAGELSPQRTALPSLPGVAGAIALSPYVAAAAGGFEQRYAAIRVPTLSVTGPDDRDSHGIGTSPSARQAPFRFGIGQAYLLTLDGIGHRVLAGNPDDEANEPGDRDEADKRTSPRGESGPPRSEGGRRGPAGGPQGGMRPGGGSDMPPNPQARTDVARQRIAIQQVTLAFLDATLRDDAIAREWLERNAPTWLDPIAGLQTRK